MAKDRFNILEALNKIEDESMQMEQELWGSVRPGAPQDTDLFSSPKFQELVQILLSDPILVAPTLNFLTAKQAQIAQAKLEALYTPEQLEEMYKDLQEKDKAQ